MVERFFADARLAALYDALCTRAQRRDFDFYRPMVMAAESVLDAALPAIRSALRPNGRFAFETRNPLGREWENWRPENAVEIIDASRARVGMVRQVEALDGRTVSFTHTFTSPIWEAPEISRSTLLDAGALNAWLQGAGLAMERQFGDWDCRPLTQTSPEIITIARRA